ncbi:hypothetical protein LRS11_21835 [Pseudomonas sp. J452]|uniref:hypothetical protein n=1 Tax=Pseudomonas sp. J452 TaxID=2898441 RepID=UPI0021AD9362|nr:hypothetical protein [Pseudomonas sp. J452]UUY08395.1 hypothetical protein LRS11_21835 [Pseudomonas sp. J452]
MIKQLLAATALLVAGTAQAEYNGSCITSELDSVSITTDFALAIGECHLAGAVDGPEGIPALEYAYSWFLQARRLGSTSAEQQLGEIEQKLKLAGRKDA